MVAAANSPSETRRSPVATRGDASARHQEPRSRRDGGARAMTLIVARQLAALGLVALDLALGGVRLQPAAAADASADAVERHHGERAGIAERVPSIGADRPGPERGTGDRVERPSLPPARRRTHLVIRRQEACPRFDPPQADAASREWSIRRSASVRADLRHLLRRTLPRNPRHVLRSFSDREIAMPLPEGWRTACGVCGAPAQLWTTGATVAHVGDCDAVVARRPASVSRSAGGEVPAPGEALAT